MGRLAVLAALVAAAAPPAPVPHVRFVFLDGLDRAYDAAPLTFENVYAALNYTVQSTTCRGSERARDRHGRLGWRRVDCRLVVAGRTGDRCDVERWDAQRRSWSPEGVGRCTGTIWHLTSLGGHFIADSHARSARFHVVLHLNQRTGYPSARIDQLPPFAPRLEKFPR